MSQWIVDETGLTGNDYYWIEKSRLLDQRGNLYEWPMQVCTKTWVDFRAFCVAFEDALKAHGKRYSKKRLAATLEAAQRRIDECAEYDAVAVEMFPEKAAAALPWWTATEMMQVGDECNRRRALRHADFPTSKAA